MSKHDTAPTMIIPAGTEIQVDHHGQLSVRTPGNLVIQNSGHYGEIESVHGSIRIEAAAEVEAVSVRCAEICYVSGSLTAWKVHARAIHLEESAQARVVLQETEGLEIGKNAQLVGNFGSEKELFLLFSRFARQLRTLPFYFDRKDDLAPPAELPARREADSAPAAEVPAAPMAVADADAADGPPLASAVLRAGQELPDSLFFALVLLEREAKRETYGSTSVRMIEQVVELLRTRDLDTLHHTHRTLFARIVEPSDDILRARELIEAFFVDVPTADG
ncbi:MAG: hypothetical protein AAF772_16310 [Acidobacteriota bacterium]